MIDDWPLKINHQSSIINRKGETKMLNKKPEF